MSDNQEFPIVIKMYAPHIEELMHSERGSFEDMEGHLAKGELPLERPLESHTYTIAQRHKTKLVINNPAEAEDVFFAVCSGTFQGYSHGTFKAACRIADVLRPIVKVHYPETVALWNKPYDNPAERGGLT
jgi:hypothetical protein